MLRLAVSQKENSTAFVFGATGAKVYTIEEALYYVYHNWRLTSDDFLCASFASWCKEIGLSFISVKISKLIQEKSFALKIMGFVSMVEFFDDSELETLSEVLAKWESRRDYDKLKERADYFTSRREPMKAIPLYLKAIAQDENMELCNNLAVAYMQLGLYKNAYDILKSTHESLPPPEILPSLIEAAIGCGMYDEAREFLMGAKGASWQLFLLGELAWKERKHIECIAFYENAIKESGGNPHYTHTLVKRLTSMRSFDAALKTLYGLEVRDGDFYVSEAHVYAASMDLPRAIKSLKQALSLSDGKDAALYTKLAEYSRKDYNLSAAEQWVTKALEADGDNEITKLEFAKIRKAQGKTRDYQISLNTILTSFKKRYSVLANRGSIQ